MSSSYPQQPPSCGPFIVTPYVIEPQDLLEAQKPSCCPVQGVCGHGECNLRVDHYRHRKTGPKHSLMVVKCRTHGYAFTLYPPGYAPYRRQAVMRVAPDGKPIYGEGKDAPEPFDDTLFDAAFDARSGRPWARQSPSLPQPPPERWWGTQGRHLRMAARLVGLAAELGDTVRGCIATILSVSSLQLRDGSHARGYRGIGKAVCDVLQRIRGSVRRRALDLLVCGHLAGHWGEPLYWDVDRQSLERSPFLPAGTIAVR